MRLLLFSILLIYSCKNKLEVIKNTPKPIVKIDYDSCKENIILQKKKLKQKWGSMTVSDKSKCFSKAVVQTIVPAWVGTTWSFNGISETPGEGSIACGYFVTTVLRDAGFPIARIKLAQCASEQMITNLVQQKYIKRFSNVEYNTFMAGLKNEGAGLFIIGLDNHTGFIYNDGSKILFIHSTYLGTRNVQIEPAINSTVLKSSKYKVIGKISCDELALQKWISNQSFK